MKRIFLTGASGLIGSFLARKFLQEGYKVRASKRPTTDLSLVQDIAGQIEWTDVDVLDVPDLERALEDVHVVVHAAAIVSYQPKFSS